MIQVAEAIHRRIREGSQPGNRTDGLKIGLALEGGKRQCIHIFRSVAFLLLMASRCSIMVCAGGMRGVVGSGMLAALDHLGYRDAFDVVYGSSAGKEILHHRANEPPNLPVSSTLLNGDLFSFFLGSLMGAYFLSGQLPFEGPAVSSMRPRR